jgi:hypothetical protein
VEFSTKEAVKKALALNESSLLSRTLKVQQVICNHLPSVKFCSANTSVPMCVILRLLESSILVGYLLFVFLVFSSYVSLSPLFPWPSSIWVLLLAL